MILCCSGIALWYPEFASPCPYAETGEFPGSASGEATEQLTGLAFLAGQERTIRLVTSVIIVPHRHPLLAAKALASLDVLSKGRMVFQQSARG